MPTATIQPETLISRSESPLSAEVQGEVVLMNLDRGQYYGLDDIASDVWRRLEAPLTVHALCTALANEYTADPAAIERDVLALLEQMRAFGLIAAG